jgi:integrase/recombinase XerC/integrase/recombinase XerD
LIDASLTLKWKVFLSLLYTTGLRLDEARHLTWADIDFDQSIVRVSGKRNPKSMVPWEPRDNEIRHIPLCREMMDLLTRWQGKAPERIPYVFLTAERYARVIDEVKKGKWSEERDLINNVLRDFTAIRQRAGISHCTIHEFRRSCITNRARQLPAPVVHKLAGHTSLETTMKYYVAVQEADLESARYSGSKFLC